MSTLDPANSNAPNENFVVENVVHEKPVDQPTQIFQETVKPLGTSAMDQDIHAERNQGSTDVKELFHTVLNDDQVKSFISDHFVKGGSWTNLMSALQNQFQAKYTTACLKEAALNAYFKEITSQLYSDTKPHEAISVFKTFDLLKHRLPEFTEAFPENRQEFDQRARKALNALNKELFPEVQVGAQTYKEAIKTKIESYLRPYLQGEINADNEPKPHIPYGDILVREIKNEFGNVKRKEIYEYASRVFMTEVIVHAMRTDGQMMYDELHQKEIENNLPKKNLMGLHDELHLSEIEGSHEVKREVNLSLNYMKLVLAKKILEALKKDFPSFSCTLENVTDYIDTTIERQNNYLNHENIKARKEILAASRESAAQRVEKLKAEQLAAVQEDEARQQAFMEAAEHEAKARYEAFMATDLTPEQQRAEAEKFADEMLNFEPGEKRHQDDDDQQDTKRIREY